MTVLQQQISNRQEKPGLVMNFKTNIMGELFNKSEIYEGYNVTDYLHSSINSATITISCLVVTFVIIYIVMTLCYVHLILKLNKQNLSYKNKLK